MNYVKAPTMKSTFVDVTYHRRYGIVTAVTAGAWFTDRLGRRVWRTRFAGTHQSVPFFTTGRTPGRALRNMRRALAVAKIPNR